MVINCKLVIDHDILKNISTQNRLFAHFTPHYIAHVAIKLRCCTIMVLAKLHIKVLCKKWPKIALKRIANTLSTLRYGQTALNCIAKTLQTLIYIYIYILWDMNFDKLTVRLHFLIISAMFAKFQENQISIAMSSIKCLNFKFL